MKKMAVFILILMFCVILFFATKKHDTFKVLKIVNSLEFYVDFNENKVCDENELVVITKIINDSFTKTEKAQLEYLAREYSEKNLLNKNVKVVYDEKGSPVVLLPKGEDYFKQLQANGFILNSDNAVKVNENLKYTKTLDLVAYNTVSHNFHKLNCKFALRSPNIVLMKHSELPKAAIPCKVCHEAFKKYEKSKVNRFNKYPREVYEKYMPVYKDGFVEFYVTDFTKYYYPSTKCLTTPCKSLLKEINSAKNSIDFAIYGVDKEPEIVKALLSAKKRGVKLRWVYDTNRGGDSIYADTFILLKQIGGGRADTDVDLSGSPAKYKDAIMHNKFFVFDAKKVWTGSANITYTDLSGFNANSAILINSQKIAQIYETEFEQMYSGHFHKLKTTTSANSTLLGASEISVFFSPQDNSISNAIVPLINSAKKYVYVPVFVITHKDFNNALIGAKNRGVDVRIIVDATSAAGKYSSVGELRKNGLKVKVENRAGKMHMKSIVIDDKYVVIGSMNFSKSGEKYNDENVMIIKNSQMASAFKSKFLHFWTEIPDKWLFKNPGAESWNSINSCFDGVDNDFDSKIDMQDDSCNFKLKKGAKTNKSRG